MKKGLLLFCLGILLCMKGQAQHKILMINGKVIQASEYSVGDMFITYKKFGGNGSTKAVDKYDVFSITRENGSEEMIYVTDSMDYSIAEAKEYIKGEQTAHTDFSRRPIKISSAIVGASAGLLSFYSLPIPIFYAVVVGRFDTHKIKAPAGSDTGIITHEPYITGYQREARNIKIQQSLKWGYISLGLSLTALIIYGVNTR